MVKKIIHLSIVIIAFCFLCVFATDNTSALTYSSNVEVGFTFNPTISVNLSGDLLINNLAPGSTSDSNIINVSVATNASQGYALTATAGTKTTNTDLVNQSNSAYKFSSIATNADLANLTTDNTWGFSYSSDNGSNWSNYSGLPLDNDDEGATGKQLLSTINPADNQTIQFKIGAKAASDQAAGTYLNTINFYAVANPDPTLQPVSCPAGKVCYNANSLTSVQGEMGQQWIDYNTEITDGSEFTLYSNNYKREGYGFAGWSDAVNGNGAKYGPNQTVTAPSDFSTNGYSLYAIWVKSAGDMQNWTGCSNLSQGEVTALKDTRDNDVYAVAKLADGKCWMIENLRLDDSDTLTTANTHNPSLPLTNIYSTNTTSNHLTQTSSSYYDATTAPEGWCQNRTAACNDQSRLNTVNTVNFINNTAANFEAYGVGDIYSRGNYYNWYSATAGHGKYSNNNYTTPGDICPAGWHLPEGGDKSNEANNEFWSLIVVGINNGVKPANYDSTTEPNYSGGTGEAAPICRILRSYPNNFVYSGSLVAIPSNRGNEGSYWSSSSSNISSFAYGLSISNTSVHPTNVDNKYRGRTVRCIAGT